MKSTLSQRSLTAVHVDSYTKPAKVKKESKAEESTDRMAALIPFWPRTISYTSLEQLTGLSKPSIARRISSCHSRYLIFSDNGRLSRLKNDMSNCDL